MDLVVSVCRALANSLRLRIHFAAATHPGISVNALAARVGVAQPVVSAQLRVLTDLGLADTRPSGRFRYASAPSRDDSRSAFIGAVNDLLCRVWQAAGEADSIHSDVWNWLPTGDETVRTWDGLAGQLVFCFTAYTHLRRLLLVRYLAQHGPATQETLCEGIGMSGPAASRQLAKLRRRGLVEVVPGGRRTTWDLARSPQPPFQQQLHQLILTTVAKG